MKKKLILSLLIAVGALSLTGCPNNSEKTQTKESTTPQSSVPSIVPSSTKPSVAPSITSSATKTTPSTEEKEYFHIYAWNDEFKGFFDKYVSDEKQPGLKKYHLDGVEVKWTIVPNESNHYQDTLDIALKNNEAADAEHRIDMFLAEADYIKKYTDSEYTIDISQIGVTDLSNSYNYAKEVATSSLGVLKGLPYQLCPSGVIYNRSIAKAILGTDNPEVIGSMLDTWEEFDAMAETMKNKDYYMTASDEETYRAFAQNKETPWVDSNNAIKISKSIEAWMDQADTYVKNGYTVAADVWSEEKFNNIAYGNEQAFCVFGPTWYYNFAMSGSKPGDWALVAGPQAHFWGGVWMLGTADTDNPELVAKTMNAFTNDEEVCKNLILDEGQHVNNQKVVLEVANSGDYKGNDFLNGQNDLLVMHEVAKSIKIANTTIFDQRCDEKFVACFREYLKGNVTKTQALNNFYYTV
ncbi:MAG: hypothetical protein IJA65_05915 [Acholeplasmatales bacterium]|nr:hypothetical protein [Acholeplasmatales bacterium]